MVEAHNPKPGGHNASPLKPLDERTQNSVVATTSQSRAWWNPVVRVLGSSFLNGTQPKWRDAKVSSVPALYLNSDMDSSTAPTQMSESNSNKDPRSRSTRRQRRWRMSPTWLAQTLTPGSPWWSVVGSSLIYDKGLQLLWAFMKQ